MTQNRHTRYRCKRIQSNDFWKKSKGISTEKWFDAQTTGYWCACVKLLQSCLTLCDPMDCSLPGSSVLGFSRQAYWSGLPGTPSGDLPDPGIEPVSLMSPSLAGGFFTTSATYEAQILTCLSLKKKKKESS